MIKVKPAGVGQIVAIASGKGGVGKTTCTVNLGLALQRLGLRVGIYDADIYGPNVPLLLGIHQTRQVKQAYASIVRAKGGAPYIKPVTRYGLQIMSVGLIIGEEQTINPLSDVVGLLVLQTLLDVAWTDLDILLLDLPPSSGEPQETLVNRLSLDGVVIITTPQDLSLLDAGRSLMLFAEADLPVLGLIENMSYFICPGCGATHEIFQRSAQWDVPIIAQAELLGRIPLDPEISRSINRHHPLVHEQPESERAGLFIQTAAKIRDKLAAQKG